MMSNKSLQKVICVSGGIGFPNGTASAKRISLIGKCVVDNHILFHLLHIGPSAYKDNKFKFGNFQGLTYEYLTPILQKSNYLILRIFCYLFGCIQLVLRLNKYKDNSVVYVYYQGNIINLWCLFLCKMYKIPIIQEACEWWPGSNDSSIFTNWMYKNIMFKWSNGAIPITHEIENRIKSIAKKKYLTCRIPVLVNVDCCTQLIKNYAFKSENSKKLLWCGMVDGYKKDIFFMLESFSKISKCYVDKSTLQIIGPCTDTFKKEIIHFAKINKISEENILISGYVNEVQLQSYLDSAYALLMPMWNDDRSRTRFPTKLGQYVFSRRPVVTAHIGELKYFLNDNTAIFYESGNSISFANCLNTLFSDETLANKIAERATYEVLPMLTCDAHSIRLVSFLNRIFQEAKSA